MVAPPHRGSRYFPPCVLVELVKVPIIDTTKVRIRWFPQLEGDPRRCDFSESLDIARELLDEHLNGWLDPRNRELLQLFFPYSILPYEVPLDYQECPARR